MNSKCLTTVPVRDISKNLEDDEIMFFCKNVMTEFPLTDEVEVDEIIIQFYANVLS